MLVFGSARSIVESRYTSWSLKFTAPSQWPCSHPGVEDHPLLGCPAVGPQATTILRKYGRTHLRSTIRFGCSWTLDGSVIKGDPALPKTPVPRHCMDGRGCLHGDGFRGQCSSICHFFAMDVFIPRLDPRTRLAPSFWRFCGTKGSIVQR